MQSHVLLSACRANEQASECALGKTREMRGWFTSTLLEILDEHEDSTAGLTYAYLFDVLLSSKARPLQHPQCLGKHKNRLLWNTTIKMSDGFPITVCEGRIVVHAGRVHGIAPRTTFVVQDDTDRRLGTLVVAELQDLRCECQCGDAPFEVAIGSRAIVKDWNNEDLSLDVYVDPELTGRHTFGQSAIPEALRDCIRVVDAPEPADLAIIKAGSDTTTLERRDPLLREFANNIAVDLDKHHIQDVISAVLHFNFHLYRRYPEPWNLLSAVRLEMYKVKQERADQPQTHYVEADTTNFFARNHEVPAYKAFAGAVVQGATMNDLEALYGLKIVNDSSFDLFPYIFYFDPDDYSIQVSAVSRPSSIGLTRCPTDLVPTGITILGTTAAGTRQPESQLRTPFNWERADQAIAPAGQRFGYGIREVVRVDVLCGHAAHSEARLQELAKGSAAGASRAR